MNISDLIKRIILDNSNLPNDELANVVAEEIKRCQRIRNSCQRIDSNIEKEKKLLESKLQELRFEKLDIQKECKHELFTFYGDPAGGNESRNVCDICDKEIR